MRTFVRIMLVVVIVGVLSACYPGESITIGTSRDQVRITGSGDLDTRVYELSGFDTVEAAHTFEVDVRYADEYSVVLRVDREVVEYLDVGVVGGRLSLTLKSAYNYNLTRVTLEAEVTMPELREVALSGASHASVGGFESAQSLRLHLSGSSELYGDIVAGDARFELSGSSTVDLQGSCAGLDVDTSGSSTVDLEEFYAENVNVRASGSSRVNVWTDGRLDADASGGSRVTYSGDVDLGSIDTSAGSSVRER